LHIQVGGVDIWNEKLILVFTLMLLGESAMMVGGWWNGITAVLLNGSLV